MKTLITMLALTLLHITSARAGGSESAGGGNGFASTPDQISAFVNGDGERSGDCLYNSLRCIVNMTFEMAKFSQELNPDYAPIHMKKILETFQDKLSGDKLEKEVKEIGKSIRLVSSAKCRDLNRGTIVDSSTKFKLGAEICFNRNRLARYPEGTYQSEITALAFHELAHHFGLKEREAIAFQEYMKPIGKRILSSFSTNAYALRPGGMSRIKASDEVGSDVLCVSGNNGPELSAQPGYTYIMIFPNQVVSLYQKGGHQAGEMCIDFPSVDCKIDNDDVFIGDRKVLYKNQKTAKEFLEEMRERKVCK